MSIAAAKNVQAFSTDMVEVTCSSQLFCRSSTPSSWASVSISKTPPSCKTIYINVTCQRWSNTSENKALRIIIYIDISYSSGTRQCQTHCSDSLSRNKNKFSDFTSGVRLTNFVYINIKYTASIYSLGHYASLEYGETGRCTRDNITVWLKYFHALLLRERLLKERVISANI